MENFVAAVTAINSKVNAFAWGPVMLVLLVGMRANDSNARFAAQSGVDRSPSGFLAPKSLFLDGVRSTAEGIFYAGTVTAPKSVGECVCEGYAAADAAAEYVKER